MAYEQGPAPIEQQEPQQAPMSGPGTPPQPGSAAMAGMTPPAPMAQEPTEPDTLGQLLMTTNIAVKLDEEKRKAIADQVMTGYTADLLSRADWEKRYETAMKLALQVAENKTFPWQGASNVKFPVLTIASMQFSARSYPTIIPSDGQVVKHRVVGDDPGGMKAARAMRVSQYMSWQLMTEMEDWDESMDKLLVQLPIVGVAFKKTYYDECYKYARSELIHAKDLVVNYWAKSLEQCERKTHQILMSKREIQEKQLLGEFLDVELKDPAPKAQPDSPGQQGMVPPPEPKDQPYLVLEQHGFYDLDGDGYAEPYIFFVLHDTGELLRVVARWDSDGVTMKKNGKGIAKILPVEYFTKYGFIPNPDGGFYDIGFGLLLGPLNESIDTLINQLIDAGSLSNLQSGFLAKNLRIKSGDASFRPGEWKWVNATGDDLGKSIFPMPVREPSAVLFNLLGMLHQATRDVSSVAEIFTGKMPGQNTPAYTTREATEQGQKLFTAIFKRVFRALNREIKKVYRLNKLFLEADKLQSVSDNPASVEDFQGPVDDIIPAADPQATTASTKMAQAEQLAKFLPMGTLDRNAVTDYMLEGMAIPDRERFKNKTPPPPPPEVQKMQMEQQAKQQEMQAKAQMEQQKFQLEMQKIQMELEALKQELQMKLEVERAKLELERERIQIERERMGVERAGAIQDLQFKQAEHQMTREAMESDHEMGMMQKMDHHEMKMQQTKEAQAAKPKPQPKGK